jgi:hypothetical protein
MLCIVAFWTDLRVIVLGEPGNLGLVHSLPIPCQDVLESHHRTIPLDLWTLALRVADLALPYQ